MLLGMVPFNEFCPRYKVCRDAASVMKEAGIVPDRRLNDNARSRRPRLLAMDEGMVPENELRWRYSCLPVRATR